MDPEANWAEALEIATRLQYDPRDGSNNTELLDDGERLAQLVCALDEWVKKGGFPPAVFNTKK